MRAVGIFSVITPRPSSPHNFNVEARRMRDRDNFEVFVDQVDKVLHGKKFWVLPKTSCRAELVVFFDLQKYNRKEICPIISQVFKVLSPLRAVSQNHEDKLESLKSGKHQYVVSSLTVKNPFSGCFGVFMIDKRFKPWEMDFIKKRSALAVVDGRSSCISIRKLKNSSELEA